MGRSRRLAEVPMPSLEKEFLTRLEACRLARIGTSTFDEAVAQKRIIVHWNGNRMIVPRVEVARYIGSLPTDRLKTV
jgi:hypothetical protein